MAARDQARWLPHHCPQERREVAETTLEALEASLRAFERQRRLLLDRLNEGER